MAIRPFLAMTAAEFRAASALPPNLVWMACHFSPYCTGLSNLPKDLPEGSLLAVDDITPIHGHDPERIAVQLTDRVNALGCCGVLLDFQREGNEAAAVLAKHLTEALPCPVAVSDLYAAGLQCPVFLPPVPPSVSLKEHLAAWEGRDIWLDTSLGGEVITLTADGAASAPASHEENCEGWHREETLHCHYQIKVREDSAEFTLCRSMEDLAELLEEAERFGVTHAVGLYQELHSFTIPMPAQETTPSR